jgi:prophage regulatory protein
MERQIKHGLAILRLKQLEAHIGLKRSAIYSKMNPKSRQFDPDFPVSVSLGDRAVGWYAHEVEEWLETLQRKHNSGEGWSNA